MGHFRQRVEPGRVGGDAARRRVRDGPPAPVEPIAQKESQDLSQPT